MPKTLTDNDFLATPKVLSDNDFLEAPEAPVLNDQDFMNLSPSEPQEIPSYGLSDTVKAVGEGIAGTFPAAVAHRAIKNILPVAESEASKAIRGDDSRFVGRMWDALWKGEDIGGSEWTQGLLGKDLDKSLREGSKSIQSKFGQLVKDNKPMVIAGLANPMTMPYALTALVNPDLMNLAGEAGVAVQDPAILLATGKGMKALSKMTKSAKEVKRVQKLADNSYFNMLEQQAANRIAQAEAKQKVSSLMSKVFAKGKKAPVAALDDAAIAGSKLAEAEAKAGGAVEAEGRLYTKYLKEMGFEVAKQKPVARWKRAFANPTEYFSALDKAGDTEGLGNIPRMMFVKDNAATIQTNIFKQSANKIVKMLKKAGISGEEALTQLRNGTLDPKITQHVKALEEGMWQVAKTQGHKLHKADNYFATMRRTLVPIKQRGKVPKSLRKLVSPKQAKEEILPGFVQSRAEEAPLPEDLYVKDLTKLISRRIGELRNGAILTPDVTANIKYNMSMLKLRGREKDATALSKYIRDTTGLGKEQDAALFLDQVVSDTGKVDLKLIEEVLSKTRPGVTRRVMRSINKVMYGSWIGTSFPAHTKQLAQPWVVAGPENGMKVIAKGQRMALKTPKKYAKVWARAKNEVANPTGLKLSELEEGSVAKTLIERGVDKYTETMLKPFSHLDRSMNRKTVFLGVYDDIMTKGLQPHHVEGLLPTQKAAITDALKFSPERAAYTAAMIRTLRSNYMYSIFDKPQLLRGALGEAVPLTTWSRNSAMRFISDWEGGNYTTLAKRLAYPIILNEMIGAVTGYHVPNFQPIQAATSLPLEGLQPYPAATTPAKQLLQGKGEKALKSAGSLIPFEPHAIRAAKDDATLGTILGYKKGSLLRSLLEEDE